MRFPQNTANFNRQLPLKASSSRQQRPREKYNLASTSTQQFPCQKMPLFVERKKINKVSRNKNGILPLTAVCLCKIIVGS